MPISLPSDKLLQILWGRTLAHVRTASSKGLFSHQAELISFSGSQANVSVRSKLLKLAENKLEPLREAMSQVVGFPVQIKLLPRD